MEIYFLKICFRTKWVGNEYSSIFSCFPNPSNHDRCHCKLFYSYPNNLSTLLTQVFPLQYVPHTHQPIQLHHLIIHLYVSTHQSRCLSGSRTLRHRAPARPQPDTCLIFPSRHLRNEFGNTTLLSI